MRAEVALAILLASALSLSKPFDALLVVIDQLGSVVAELDVLFDPLENRVDLELADLDFVRKRIDPIADPALPLLAFEPLFLSVLFRLLAKLLVQLLALLHEAILECLLFMEAIAKLLDAILVLVVGLAMLAALFELVPD